MEDLAKEHQTLFCLRTQRVGSERKTDVCCLVFFHNPSSMAHLTCPLTFVCVVWGLYTVAQVIYIERWCGCFCFFVESMWTFMHVIAVLKWGRWLQRVSVPNHWNLFTAHKRWSTAASCKQEAERDDKPQPSNWQFVICLTILMTKTHSN